MFHLLCGENKIWNQVSEACNLCNDPPLLSPFVKWEKLCYLPCKASEERGLGNTKAPEHYRTARACSGYYLLLIHFKESVAYCISFTVFPSFSSQPKRLYFLMEDILIMIIIRTYLSGILPLEKLNYHQETTLVPTWILCIHCRVDTISWFSSRTLVAKRHPVSHDCVAHIAPYYFGLCFPLR